MTDTEQVPYLRWCTSDITKSRVEDYKENPDNAPEGFAGWSEEKQYQYVWEDPDIYQWEWESLTDCLTDLMKELNSTGRWRVTVENFGWQGKSGYKICDAETGRQLLEAILPQTDCTFNLFKEEDGTIKIRNWHHDSPVGNEWYTIERLTPDMEDYE